MQDLRRYKVNYKCKSADATRADRPGRVHAVVGRYIYEILWAAEVGSRVKRLAPDRVAISMTAGLSVRFLLVGSTLWPRTEL